MRIAVLLGGTSAERDVSLVTGQAVGSALAERGHDVLLVDTAVGEEALPPTGEAEVGATPPSIRGESGAAVRAVAGEAVRQADVVFVALHGGTGEDGTVQGLLELAGKRYTGSDVRASAIAMDKRVSKLLFREVAVPTPDWRVIAADAVATESVSRGCAPSFPEDLTPSEAGRAVEELGGCPVVVKPNDQGSTVGLTIVRDPDDIAPAVELAGSYSQHVLIEPYVEGREMTVAVLGAEALPVVEIAPKSGFYDYRSKYTVGATVYTCPAEIDDGLAAALKEAGMRAFHALGCRGYARVDFRVGAGGEVACLEVNTVPGMTETSLVPMAARAAGLDFGELVDRIVSLALK